MNLYFLIKDYKYIKYALFLKDLKEIHHNVFKNRL